MRNWLFCLSLVTACSPGEKTATPPAEADSSLAEPQSQAMPDAIESAPLAQPEVIEKQQEMESHIHGSADQSQVDSIKAAKARLKKRKNE